MTLWRSAGTASPNVGTCAAVLFSVELLEYKANGS